MAMICLSMLFIQFVQATAVEALDAAAAQTYETTFTDTNNALSGGMTSRQQYFQIPPYWQVSEVKVNLDYQASPLLMNELSSVTMIINGTTFHSFRPVASKDTKQRVTVTIPAELIIKGTNTLTIEGNIQSTTNPELACPPPQTRESWLQVYNTSSVRVQYAATPMNGTISDFNQHFIGLDTVQAGHNAIAVPLNSSSSELEAAVYALSGFSKANSLKDKIIPILSYSPDNLKDKTAVVVIALYDSLPAELKSLLSSDQDLSSNAIIQLVNTDKQHTLVVTSKSFELLVKAGRFVANQALMGQLNSASKVVNELTEVASPVTTISKNVILTETGDRISGSMHREKTYFVPLPANRSIAEASKINLDFRYAKNLDFDRSMVTLLVNNAPIGSKKLTAVLADGDNMTVPIPKNLNTTGNFTVTVAFDLELKNNVSCIQNQNEMPWAFITKDSMLQLNTKDRTDLLFNNYPYPFLRDGIYNNVAVILPDQRDFYTFQTITNLFNLLGQYAEGNSGEVKFYGAGTEAKDLKDKQIIAIGTYQNNKIIRENNSKLYFQYDLSGSGIRSNEKMSIEAGYGKRIGTLQLIDSPYGAGHGLLAVTGAGSEYYYLASKLLASEGTIWKVFGDGAVTDKDGNIQAYRFKKQADQAQSTVISDVLQRKDVLGFMIAIVLVLVLVLLSLILMIRKYRLKRGKMR
ncbi:MAG: cellulose synthase [Paenibacillus sp.]|nr:cellulose synthase [Paenibacillus sp.]